MYAQYWESLTRGHFLHWLYVRDVETIKTKLMRRRLEWLEHLDLMQEHRLPKMLCVYIYVFVCVQGLFSILCVLSLWYYEHILV